MYEKTSKIPNNNTISISNTILNGSNWYSIHISK